METSDTIRAWMPMAILSKTFAGRLGEKIRAGMHRL